MKLVKIIVFIFLLSGIYFNARASCSCTCSAIVYHNGTPTNFYYNTPPFFAGLQILPGDSVQLMLYRDSGCGQEMHTWTKNGNFYYADFNSSSVIMVYDTGYYQCSFTINTITLNFTADIDYSTTSISQNDSETGLNVYPNPFNEFVSIDITTTNSADVSYCIYNYAGQEIKTFHKSNVFGELNVFEDFENISQGIYLLRIIIGDRIFDKKLVRL
jgi:hypothetical protein